MTPRNTHLVFDTKIGGTKPITVVERGWECPFCCRDELTGILDADGPIILLTNKYPVLEDTDQTVLIETDDCDGEFSNYPKEHLYRLLRFGLAKWLEMMDSGKYASVLFFKNHGPCSGGTIRHPHMQIVGLKTLDYSPNIPPACLAGKLIAGADGVELRLAEAPLIGFVEFNVILEDTAAIDRMADYLQTVTHYLLNHFNKHCNSYNIFFYRLGDRIVAKVLPRFVTSPIYVGYAIPQVSSRAGEIMAELKSLYNL